MTEPKPRKSLWELMGQKSPEEVPPATAEPQSEGAPASQSSVPGTDAAGEPPQPTKGKGLWALMHHSDPSDENDVPAVTDDMRAAFEAPVKPTDKRLRQMAEAEAEVEIVEESTEQVPAKRVDKRLRQVEELEVEIVDDDRDTPSRKIDKRLHQVEEPEVEIVDDDEDAHRRKIDKRLRQTEAPEVEIVDESSDEDGTDDESSHRDAAHRLAPSRSKIRGIPSPFDSRSAEALPDDVIGAIPDESRSRFSFVGGGRSKTALWSVILGGLSLPLSLIAIYPAIWSRIPASVTGFGALLLGFLAQGELTRSGHKGRDLILAYVGMAAGLLAMFSGPLIYTPLDVYGQWSNSYTGGHLQQIGLATEAYSQQQHSFPAGGLFKEIPDNPELEPLHGWMTLLLPHLPEGAGLARQINLSKPYFDAANLPAMSQPVPTFMAAGGSTLLIQGKYGPAHFAGLGGLISLPDGSVAHAGVFDVNSETTRDQVIDGLSNTIMAGEVSANYPAWGEPRNWRQIGKGLNRDPDGFGNSRHTGAMFLMADGSVRFLPNHTDPKVLQALSTRDGEDQP